jgi:tyrosyl-tRNA synthetase
MTFSEELLWRGFINQTTFSDLKELDNKKWTFYHGFDASADSQTVGNLAAMMLDRAFLRNGHNAILLAGGATSLIGDPGGKDAERPLPSEEAITGNVKNAEEQIRRVLSGHDFKLVNNLDWTRDLKLLDFLRDIGKHFSMTPLIQRDYIAKRLGEGGGGISYAEFSYTLLQGMDYLHLYDTLGATLQLGGADQWGNCLSGVDLIRRTRGVETHVITLPLVVNKATGKKFGKSEEGAVWLDAKRTSPEQFYQFWINADDEGVEGYLRIFTELPKSEVDKIMAEFNDNRAGRAAQKRLAEEVTRLVHGQEALKAAKQHATGITQTVSGSTDAYLHRGARVGSNIVDLLVESKLVGSKGEARRLLAGGGVYINDQPTSEDQVHESDFVNDVLKLRRGKTLQNTAVFKRIS